MMYCPECMGNVEGVLDDDGVYCEYCGLLLWSKEQPL